MARSPGRSPRILLLELLRSGRLSSPERRLIVGILSWILFGLLAGVIGKLLMPGSDPGGGMVTILLGICGALVGGFIGTLLGFGSVSGFNVASLAVAVAGAMVLLLLYRAVKKAA
jgi:uncharacterized membrane protein YeaQ/YmgE (transglycosylase-associated protein family)